MVSKKTIFIVLIIGLGAGWLLKDFNFTGIGNKISLVNVNPQKPKCADSYILLDFNDFPSLTNITIDWLGKAHGMMSKEEMDKYRFTMTVGEVYLPHGSWAGQWGYDDQSGATSEYRYLGGGVLCIINRYFDPDYVKEYKYHMSVGDPLMDQFTFCYDTPLGGRRISTVVYEVLPKIIVFKITGINDEHSAVGYWWEII